VSTLFEQLGGEPVLRAVIDRFVERLFADPMIGFFFLRASKERIKAKEYEFAAAHLGADVEYTGRPLQVAHGSHPIMGGHFQRRLEILRQTLREAGAPEPVVAHWIRHTEQLRPVITAHEANDCRHDVPAETLQPRSPAPPPRSVPRRELPLAIADGTPANRSQLRAHDEEGKSQ